MAAQKGSDFLLKVLAGGSPSADYETIGGLRSKSMTINNSMVDITDQDSGDWREILAEAGIQTVEVSGSGVFKDSVSEEYVRAAALANTHMTMQIVVPGQGTFSGTFAIANYRLNANHEDALAFDITLQSNGAVSFT